MNPNFNSTYLFDDPIYLQQQSFQHTLDADFFQILSETQKSYEKTLDQKILLQLVAYYTDCVSYFQVIQEPVSQYFQNKIKELMKNIKCFGSPEQKKKNKNKLENQIVKQMESASVERAMNKALMKQMNQKELQNESIRQQELRLMKRIQKSKRSMHKSQSLSFSYGSIQSSPQARTSKIKNRVANLEIEQLKSKNAFLFQKDINSSQDEQNTVG